MIHALTKAIFQIISLALILSVPMASGYGQSVKNLRCEYLVNPIGIDTDHPRFTWILQDSTRGAAQTAYRIVVGTDSLAVSHRMGNIWDSKKILGSLNLVSMPGPFLKPFTKYYWSVIVWNQVGKLLAPDHPASFETGMMQVQYWQGSWISDGGSIQTLEAPYFRKVFSLSKTVQSARAYIAVGGLYELSLNGRKIGDHRLDPMYTRYDRKNFYITYDITDQLLQGANAVGVLLGNGWYNHQSLAVWNFDRAPWRNRPTFCLDIKINYKDGTTQTITSDQSWKTHTGPLVFNSIYTGEHYDARKEIPGWNTASYVDTAWNKTYLRAAPSQTIVSQQMSPIKNVSKISAVRMTRFSDTNYVFDLGQNIAGVTQTRLNGAEGTIVRIKHGERLQKDHHVDVSNIDVYYRPVDDSDPYGTDIVVLNGQGPVDFMPKFNYKGFQYVEISSSKPVILTMEDVTGWFMHSDVTPVGKIDCSNPLINKLWWATNNSYLSNLFGYPTDCPQREKNGWTGDGHFAVETGLFNFDGITIYEKWMADHRDEQQPNGVLPDIIPTGGWGYGTANGTDWTSTIAIIPWNLYLFYGDKKPLKDNYLSIKQYLKYIESISPSGLTTFGRGDWVPVRSSSPLEYTSSIYYFVDATILAKSAKLFGISADEKYYKALALKIKKAINDKYFNSVTNIYGSGLQTEMSMALQWGIVPPELESKVAANLASRVRSDGMHLDVGVLGAKAILNALSDYGQAATAYSLAAQDTYPSWGWWIKNGATTLYENWNIQATRDISLNHMMFGEIGAWFFKGLGGIHPDEAAPGFKNIRLSPHFVSQLNHFSASHHGPYGTILSSWQRLGDSIQYAVTIPANSTATVEFDLNPGQQIKLEHKIIPGKISLSSGSYLFMIK